MNGVLVVDKGRGCTSHDVVAIARRVLGTRSVGHAGTLDPMATGVLVVAVGEGTKLVSHLTAADKEYEAELTLGSATISGDADGEVTESRAVPPLSVADIERVLPMFLGEIAQVAPAVSAIKVDGERLHVKVRRGEVVAAPTRFVRCDAIEILSWRSPVLRLRVRCGKGFYVRSLARDLAVALGTVSHLTALRRTRSGPFSLEAAVSFDALLAAKADESLRPGVVAAILPMAQAWGPADRAVLSAAGVDHAFHGRPVTPADVVSGMPGDGDDRVVACFDGRGQLVALARREGEVLRIVRGFRSILSDDGRRPA